MKKYDLKILQEYVDRKLLHMQVHPTLPLRIYKYTQECVFSRSWDEITLNMRGTVVDADGNVYSNPFPKFFNFEELEIAGISLPKETYKVYDKVDGSLIQIFMYNGQFVVTSMGSFASDHAVVAEKMFNEKYSHLKEFINNEHTYLFELIYPLNKIVLHYGDEEKLMLLAVRDTETGEETPGALESARELGFDVVEEIELSLDELETEIKRGDFINKEGFVVVYENGLRIKMKYAEYFRLHKIVSNVNEKFVWEFVSQGKPIDLHEIPDETFQFIEDTKKMLLKKFDEKWNEANVTYSQCLKEMAEKHGDDGITKRNFALHILPQHKKMAGVLFNLFEGKTSSAAKIIWKKIMPRYEKGYSGFQSMKIEA